MLGLRLRRSGTPLLAIVLFSICAVATAQPANVLVVDDDAEPGGNGTSWQTPFRYLQDAIIRAEQLGGSREIWVAAGIYHPDQSDLDPTISGRTASFALRPSIPIFGGFLGGENDRDERQVLSPATEARLSGDIDPGAMDSYHVVTGPSSGTQLARLDGFTIVGGRANGDWFADENKGAGIALVSGTNVLIANCLITGNSAGEAGCDIQSIDGIGAGIWVERVAEPNGAGNPTIMNCSIRDNLAVGGDPRGGGIEIDGQATVTIVNTTITDNHARTILCTEPDPPACLGGGGRGGASATPVRSRS